MEAESPEVISAEPSRIASKGPWLIGAALVAVALAVAVVSVVRYHGAAALRQQAQSAGHSRPFARLPQVTSAVYALPAGGQVTGKVTVFNFWFAGGLEQVVVSARLTGARPHIRYEVVAADCTASSASEYARASGTSDAHGTARLTGRAWTVTPGDYYAIWLTPSPARSGPGLHGYLTSAGGLSPIGDGHAPCAP